MAEEKKDTSKIKSLVDEISQLAQQMGAAMYQQQKQEAKASESGKEEVHDTEAKEKDAETGDKK